MIALVHGPDAALARAEVATLVQRHDPGRANTSVLDGRTVPLGHVVTSIATAGFFGERRVVVVHDLMARVSRTAGAGDGANDEPSASGLDLTSLFRAVPPENVLILVDADLGSVPAAIRKIAPADVQIVGGEPPRGTLLVEWLRRSASDAGSELDAATARYLAETLFPQTWSAKPANPRFDRPPNLDLLGNEVSKLALVAHPGPIQRRHIDALVAAGDDDRIFRFIEAAATGRVEIALTELRRLLDAGEEPAKLSAQILQQIELMGILGAAGTRVDAATAGRAIGLANPGRMAAIAASLRGRPPGAAPTAIAASRTVDRRSKRGELRQPEDGLYDLLIALSSQQIAHDDGVRRRGGT